MTSFVYMHGAVAVPLVVREDRAEAGRSGGEVEGGSFKTGRPRSM